MIVSYLKPHPHPQNMRKVFFAFLVSVDKRKNGCLVRMFHGVKFVAHLLFYGKNTKKNSI